MATGTVAAGRAAGSATRQGSRRGEAIELRLYVGNLAHDTTDADLRAAFAQFGEVKSIKVATDRRGRPKGFAHVDMETSEAADAAIEGLRNIQINFRTPDIVPEQKGRPRPPRRR